MQIAPTLRALTLSTLAVALPALASAQEGFQVEQFEPLPAQGTNILNISKSETLGHLTPAAGLFLHVQDDPLQVVDRETGEIVSRVVDHQFKAEFSGAIGLFGWFDLGLVLPVTLAQSGEPSDVGAGFSGASLSDIRLIPRLQLIDGDKMGGFGVALAAPIQLPTGNQDTYNSDGGLRAEPRLIVDFATDWLTVAANFGVDFRPVNDSLNYAAGNAIRYGLGLGVPIVDPVSLIGSFYGSVGLAEGRNPENLAEVADNAQARPMELLGGVQFDLPMSLVAQLGAGSGLNSSVGSPDFRIFASIGYTPRDADADGDGILDADDQCPADPEDFDDFEDADGCPDADNDQDGILDGPDQCPNEPEDVDQFEDENGCPDPDNDQDGVLDADDRCPLQPGPADNAGCPVGDSDGDGLLDDVDQCPNAPEDMDTFEDEDGCPDPDNDQDGILDPNDKCPFEKEVINGVDDEDGCPDEGETKVIVEDKKIRILDKVFFDYDKATIQERSFSILNQVASVMKANPQITKVRIEGHTDSKGSDSYNLDLSKQRAASVMEYLKGKGIDASRLESEGYGETKPIADNDTKAGRDQNRRVEFTIIEIDGKPAETDTVEEPAQ